MPKELVTKGLPPDEANLQGDITRDEGSRSNIESLPSNASDDLVGLSDIPIMKIDDTGYTANVESIYGKEGRVLLVPTSSKPQGSAYISVKMSIGTSSQLVLADLCVDTGADFTICDSAFLKAHWGKMLSTI